MNDSSQHHIAPPPPPPRKTRHSIRVCLLIDQPLHQEVSSALKELTPELGHRLTMPQFVLKTFRESWKLQLDRYRKYGATLKGKQA